MLRLLLTVIVFVVTLGGLFYGGSFSSQETAQVPVLDLIAQRTITPTNSKPSTKTASIIDSLKNIVSESPSPIPAASLYPSLPELVRMTPTPAVSGSPALLLPPNIPLPTISVVVSPSPTPISTPTLEPVQNSEPIYITSTLPLNYAQKTEAQLQIQTYPQTPCSIKVTWPSGSISTSKSLAPQISDESGFITWTWSVNWNTKIGTGKIDLFCTYNSQSYSKSMPFVVTSS